MVVTVADRFETMATAVAASYMNLPLVHVQGGEVTGSIDEKVRHAITKLADVHLVSCDAARDRVIKMGEVADRVFVTGCPSIDLAREAAAAEPRNVAETLSDYGGVGADVDLSEGYIVVLQHPVTTEYEQTAEHARKTLHAVHEGRWPTLWFWPNVDAGSDGTSSAIRQYRELHALRQIHFYKNLRPLDFLSILLNSRGIVGNSSVAIRECAYLGVPAVNIGSRQQGRDRGRNVRDVEYDTGQISDAVGAMFIQDERPRDTIYGDGTAGRQIADTLAECELSIEKMLTY
jgi:UDP-hydrolysing UDP-N-acetyl-D-glucosamine 2-epimerase